ncbi:hypothetical protein D9V87_00560 [Bacteroidetes/Chlorobi group bacterium MS-B_bin-24]|jgi:hypothetical protein|nr:MAG: hypothetical protein D9V87_00560 [Bacteroidetes/Chlorobi group bacterium MS-B_bin-24]
MDWFERLIDAFIWISLLMSVVQVYLQTNKIWKRKHERVVAESQSIAGLSLLILNCLIWLISYIMKNDIESIIDTSLIIAQAMVFLLVGTGLWVRGQRKMGFWRLVKQAIRIEKKEANYLLKRFFKPQNAEIIIDILHNLAMIDEEFDEREKKLIEFFAMEWNIPYSAETKNKERKQRVVQNKFVDLRNKLLDYLSRDPPVEQVAQLKDLINEMILADEKITSEEKLVSGELLGIIDSYLQEEERKDVYQVIIVPQNPNQEQKIKELLPDSESIETFGGIVYSVGSFYSKEFAEMVCQRFRKMNFFAIVYNLEDIIKTQNNMSS